MQKNIARLTIGGAGVVLLAALWMGGITTTEEKAAEHIANGQIKEVEQQYLYFGAGFGRESYRLPNKKVENTVRAVSGAAAVSRTNVIQKTEEVSPSGVQPEVIQPEPEPNVPAVVSMPEPSPEPAAAEEPTPGPVELPVTSSVEAPGAAKLDHITVVPPEPEEPTPTPSVQPSSPGMTQEDQMASIQGGCTIMGNSYTYLEQMVRYYNVNQTYPAYYANSDAPTIEAFCQIYIEEAKAEGVRAEVAFCQAMKETGFLRYLGDVRIEQYNFAGIGATGNGVAGDSFASVRDGIRAQIQHLKAYASTESLNNPCVDPRFHYVNRGTTPYVEWLGIHENPMGGGWAAAVNYGSSIINDYIVKLFSN
ncbi:MAG: hypothetical protein HFI75_02055 [Lachnospiraceae bacterium]|nr:hypothetical protein [Lachnospiraceae bacterium]